MKLGHAPPFNPIHQATRDRSVVLQALATLSRFGAEALAKAALEAFDRVSTGYPPIQNPCPDCQGYGGKAGRDFCGAPTIGTCEKCKGWGIIDKDSLKL